MKHFFAKAPCGAVIDMQFADETAFQAYIEKLTRDHQKDGPGCHACKPENWVVPRTGQPPDGSSLLDR